MNTQEVLKILEVDLTDSNITVFMKPISRDDFGRMYGAIGITYGDPNRLRQTITRHLDGDRNFLVYENPVLLESQLQDIFPPSAITFYPRIEEEKPEEVLLTIRKVGYSFPYEKRKRINFREITTSIEADGLIFAPKSSESIEILKIEKFKSTSVKLQEAKQSQTKIDTVLKPVDEIQTRENWIAIPFKTSKKIYDILGIIHPPRIAYLYLEDFNLAHLSKTFRIGDFERELKMSHVYEIVEAILKNRLFDNVIRIAYLGTYDDNTHQFGVIDGQHRIKALDICHETYGLTNYNLMLAIYPQESEETVRYREIYLNVNLGKTLTLRDRVKTHDDGTNIFFNSLRDYLLHYPSGEGISFAEVLNAQVYCNTENTHPKINNIQKALGEIKEPEIKNIKLFLDTFMKVFGLNRTNNLGYRSVVFRNIFKIFYENKLGSNELVIMMERVKKDSRIRESSKQKLKENYTLCYDLIREHLYK